MQRQIIAPAQVERLRDCLRISRVCVKVYFQVMDGDSPLADYVAEITRSDDSQFGYTLGGHGIGINTRHPVSLDLTIERVLKDNTRFNNGQVFTFEHE